MYEAEIVQQIKISELVIYSLPALHFQSRKKNFLTGRLAHYTNTQVLPTATACFPVTVY